MGGNVFQRLLGLGSWLEVSIGEWSHLHDRRVVTQGGYRPKGGTEGVGQWKGIQSWKFYNLDGEAFHFSRCVSLDHANDAFANTSGPSQKPCREQHRWCF